METYDIVPLSILYYYTQRIMFIINNFVASSGQCWRLDGQVGARTTPPFVSLCQAWGFIPYVMEYQRKDVITKKFVRFTFSFKYFTTWWFSIVAVLQFWIPFIMTSTFNTLTNEMTTNHVPRTIIILNIVNSIGFSVQYVMCRWIGFRYSRLRRVVEAIQCAEKLLGTISIARKNSIKERFVIGFTLIFVVVSILHGYFNVVHYWITCDYIV